jgi:hypothetical protein
VKDEGVKANDEFVGVDDAALAVAELSLERRNVLLADLCLQLSMCARGEYPEAQAGDLRVVPRLICLNELVNVVSSGLLVSMKNPERYSNEHLFRGLTFKTRGEGACRVYLEWCLARCLERARGIQTSGRCLLRPGRPDGRPTVLSGRTAVRPYNKG